MKKINTYISGINIQINCDKQVGGFGIPSDESINKFNDWLFSYNFGDFGVLSLEVSFFTLIDIKIFNNHQDYSKINDIVKIINTNANKILKK